MALYDFRVSLSGWGSGGPGMNVWNVRIADDPIGGVEDQQENASLALKNFYTGISGLFPTSYRATFNGELIDVATKEIGTISSWTVAGTSSGSGYGPTLAQLILTLRTSNASRRGRGRKFIGPCIAGAVEADGTPASGPLNTLQTAATALLNASQGSVNGWAIGVRSGVDNLHRDVTAIQARDYFASLRSRRD